MALFDLKNLKKSIEKSADLLKESVQNLPESIKEVNVADSMKQLAKKSEDVLDTFKSKTSDALSKKEINSLTIKSSLQIIYYLMAGDGQILPEEEQQFELIGKEMDPDFESHKESIIDECKKFLSNDNDLEVYQEDLRDGIKEAIREGKGVKNASVNMKHLVWNLYAIAYCDGECSDEETKLIRYIARSLELDKTICLELEQTLQTVLAIENEIQWIRSSTRPYSVVEAHYNELVDRKRNIMQSVYDLIAD